MIFIQSLIPACLFLFVGYLSCEGAIAEQKKRRERESRKKKEDAVS